MNKVFSKESSKKNKELDLSKQWSLNKNISEYLKASNKSLLSQISYYSNQLEETKGILSKDEFYRSSNVIEVLVMNYKSKLKENNSTLKSAFLQLKSNYDQNEFDLSQNIEFETSKLDRVKEDNFLLTNAIKEKNTIIHQINLDLNKLQEFDYSSILKTESYAHYSEKRIETCQNYQLNYYQLQLAYQSKKHNKELIKSSRLNTEAYEIKKQLMVTKEAKESTQRNNKDYNDDGVKLTESLIEKYKEKAIELDIKFNRFEKEKNDKHNNEPNIKDHRIETIENDNRLLTTERDTYNNSNTKRIIPKLDLKQIEFNKSRINRVINKRADEINNNSFSSNEISDDDNNDDYDDIDIYINKDNNKKSNPNESNAIKLYSNEDQYAIKIENLKKQIEEIRMKVLSNYELICDFKRFCYRFKIKYTNVNFDLNSDSS